MTATKLDKKYLVISSVIDRIVFYVGVSRYLCIHVLTMGTTIRRLTNNLHLLFS